MESLRGLERFPGIGADLDLVAVARKQRCHAFGNFRLILDHEHPPGWHRRHPLAPVATDTGATPPISTQSRKTEYGGTAAPISHSSIYSSVTPSALARRFIEPTVVSARDSATTYGV